LLFVIGYWYERNDFYQLFPDVAKIRPFTENKTIITIPTILTISTILTN